MLTIILVIFLVGYLLIALEHPLKINKAASALLTGTLLWIVYMGIAPDLPFAVEGTAFQSFIQSPEIHSLPLDEQMKRFILSHQIVESLGEICSTLVFLIGAMTIVELIDAHGGFVLITNRIKTRKKRTLLIITTVLTFFMSAILDNLTTAIVMTMLIRKLIKEQYYQWLFSSVVIIAANSGGAWSPIGDVTTIMLWIKGNVTAGSIIPNLILPSLVSTFVPMYLILKKLDGDIICPPQARTDETNKREHLGLYERFSILILGLIALISVPLFKMQTQLPPFMGILFGISLLWIYTEALYSRKKEMEEKDKYRMERVIHQVDGGTLLFFLGILLAVDVLRYTGMLNTFSEWLDVNVGNVYAVNLLIGGLSSIVDNVPLVAGAIGMYPVATEEVILHSADAAYMMNFMQDGTFWQFLAYCAGVGGSMLIIGSAAGVVVMGLQKINFLWYLKHISRLAAAGYLSGAIVFILQSLLLSSI